jgi:DNA-binding CsgD family transcriptional regulator
MTDITAITSPVPPEGLAARPRPALFPSGSTSLLPRVLRSTSRLRPWGLPAIAALVVALVLVPTALTEVFALPGLDLHATVTEVGTISLSTAHLVWFASCLASLTGVVLARHRLTTATWLLAVPYVLMPAVGMIAWGWWLAAVLALAIAVYDGERRRAVPLAAGVGAYVVVVTVLDLPALAPLGTTYMPGLLYDEGPVGAALKMAGFLLVNLGAVGLLLVVADLLGRRNRAGAALGTTGPVASTATPEPAADAARVDRATASASASETASESLSESLSESESASDGERDDVAWLASLTPRETDVFRALVRGRSNAEVAAELFVGEETVKTHVKEVLRKTGCRDRVHLVIAAYEAGLARPRR